MKLALCIMGVVAILVFLAVSCVLDWPGPSNRPFPTSSQTSRP